MVENRLYRPGLGEIGEHDAAPQVSQRQIGRHAQPASHRGRRARPRGRRASAVRLRGCAMYPHGRHHVRQIAQGWTDSHLHEFEISRKRYGMPDRGGPRRIGARRKGLSAASVASEGKPRRVTTTTSATACDMPSSSRTRFRSPHVHRRRSASPARELARPRTAAALTATRSSSRLSCAAE